MDGVCQLCEAALEKPYTRQNIEEETRTTPGMSSLARRPVRGWRRSSAIPPMAAIAAKTTFTYKHQRQERYSVSRPPTTRPTAPPPPAMAP